MHFAWTHYSILAAWAPYQIVRKAARGWWKRELPCLLPRVEVGMGNSISAVAHCIFSEMVFEDKNSFAASAQFQNALQFMAFEVQQMKMIKMMLLTSWLRTLLMSFDMWWARLLAGWAQAGTRRLWILPKNSKKQFLYEFQWTCRQFAHNFCRFEGNMKWFQALHYIKRLHCVKRLVAINRRLLGAPTAINVYSNEFQSTPSGTSVLRLSGDIMAGLTVRAENLVKSSQSDSVFHPGC